MVVKLALPKGRLLRKTAALLQQADWRLDEYHSDMGFYRPRSGRYPDVLIRIFHEKDIPVQIASGNYDLGICGSDWIEELMVKYPSSGLVKLIELGYCRGCLYTASSGALPAIPTNGSPLRAATRPASRPAVHPTARAGDSPIEVHPAPGSRDLDHADVRVASPELPPSDVALEALLEGLKGANVEIQMEQQEQLEDFYENQVDEGIGGGFGGGIF